MGGFQDKIFVDWVFRAHQKGKRHLFFMVEHAWTLGFNEVVVMYFEVTFLPGLSGFFLLSEGSVEASINPRIRCRIS